MKTHENPTDVFHCDFTGFLVVFQRIFRAQFISGYSLDFHPTKTYNQQILMQHFHELHLCELSISSLKTYIWPTISILCVKLKMVSTSGDYAGNVLSWPVELLSAS